MISKKPAPDLIRGENRFSEKVHAQAKSWTMIPIQSNGSWSEDEGGDDDGATA
jgi:hypothetical protein